MSLSTSTATEYVLEPSTATEYVFINFYCNRMSLVLSTATETMRCWWITKNTWIKIAKITIHDAIAKKLEQDFLNSNEVKDWRTKLSKSTFPISATLIFYDIIS